MFVPVYNGSHFLADSVESILNQSFDDFDLIVLDDASTDDSLDVAASISDPRISIRTSSERLGLAGNWNRAIELAQTEFFVIVHQDDVYLPEYLEKMTGFLRAHPDAFAAHCPAEPIDESGETFPSAEHLYKSRFWRGDQVICRDPADELSILAQGNYVICPSVIYRASLVKQVGKFSPSYEFVTDWEYWVRGLLKGYRLAGCPERLVQFRRHAGTTTQSLEDTLERFSEEKKFLEWLEKELRNRKMHRSADASHCLLDRLVTSHVISRLARDGKRGARELLDFSDREGLPFSDSVTRKLLGLFVWLGRPAGKLLEFSRDAAIRSLPSIRSRER